MKPATQKAINAAIAKYKADIIKQLTEAAPKAHIAGDLAAYAKLKPIAVDFTLVQAEALKYSKDYSKMLYTKGGSMIDGKFVPWLRDSTAQKRQNIAKIITDGLKAGKPTTAIGGKALGKGTIAYNLAKECSDKGDSWAAMTARTETARIQGHGAMDRYKEQEIEEVKYLCGPDPCEEICAPDCQKIFKINEAPEQPRHPRCVCDYAPIVKREKPEEIKKEVVKPTKPPVVKEKKVPTKKVVEPKKKVPKKKEELEKIKTEERATANELWKKTDKDGYEHAKVTNSITDYASGNGNSVYIRSPRTSFKSSHTHPGWDAPLSGADMTTILKESNCTRLSAASSKRIFVLRRTKDTKYAPESFKMLKEKFTNKSNDIYRKAMAAYKKKTGKVPTKTEASKIWGDSILEMNKTVAKEYNLDYAVFSRI